jgi:hypothetical protein
MHIETIVAYFVVLSCHLRGEALENIPTEPTRSEEILSLSGILAFFLHLTDIWLSNVFPSVMLLQTDEVLKLPDAGLLGCNWLVCSSIFSSIHNEE